MFMFSIYSVEIPPGYFGAAQCWLFSCVRPLLCARLSAAQGQLEAALISFGDPGDQHSEADTGKWGLTKLSLRTINVQSSAKRGGAGVTGRPR